MKQVIIMDKPAIKKFAIWARNKLIADTKYRAGLVGVTETAVAEPLPQSNETVQFFDVGLPQPYRIEGEAVTQRQRFVAELNKETAKQGGYTAAYQTVVDKVAYTWFNRLIAVRYMEVNDLLPSRTRVLSSADGRAEPQIVTSPFDAVLDYSPAEQQQIVNLKNDNKLDEAFRLLFLKQCAALGDCLPRLFEQVDDYMPLLLAISFTDKDGVVCHLVNDIPESDWQDAVQIVGWLYQYYNTEPKEQVFANLKKNIKISKENVPAATQLFTPDWIVRYMVENSLGRLWSEGHPDFDKSEWKYYLDEAPQEPQVAQQLAELRKGYAALTPEDIKCIDPCMGSGHILAYLFDVLMQIYRSAGYGDRDAAASIVEHNLYGLDIDDRAAQMAYFVVMMKGCHYDSRFLRRHLNPHVYAIQESGELTTDALGRLGKQESTARALLDGFKNAKEYGSILQLKVALTELDALQEQLREVDGASDMGSFTDQFVAGQLLRVLCPLMEQARMLVQKYDVVVTNPPYMGLRNMSSKLFDYVTLNYPMAKSDLYGAFVQKCVEVFCARNGYVAMITQHVWMFTSGFEKLRRKIIKEETIIAMAHLGTRAFEDISGEVVQTCAFVLRRGILRNYKGVYSRLVDYETPLKKEVAFLQKENQYIQQAESYEKMPGAPICYWISDKVFEIYETSKLIGEVSTTRQGLKTSDDKRFIRFFFEVNKEKIANGIENVDEAAESSQKWFWLNKGGQIKWYGNNLYVINWEQDGKEVKEYATKVAGSYSKNITAIDAYFKECISWPQISISHPSFRYIPKGYIFASAGPSLFVNDSNEKWYFLGLLNSCVTQTLLDAINPTINFGVSDVLKVPYIFDKQKQEIICDRVEESVSFGKSNWDSFETSWDFAEHPLVKWSRQLWDATFIGATMAYYYHGERPEVSCPVERCYLLWQGECNDRFAKLKANEEELNRIFIDIYGLQDELTPEVEDKDVTVRRADLGRDIRSLISYAVGCIFGRYSLDKPGLAYAGGDWNPDQYHTFTPDADNVIPITDEEYFPDDLTGLFVAWVKKVFGADSLEDNLAFIAKALGTKGTSPRAVIRNYFLNGFYADHVKIYQKRPIYWLYDSGKQNGFKALIYMHRYNADTSGLVRADYLYKMEQVYESEIARMDDAIAHGASREVAQATKRKEKLVKQLKECKDYDDRLGHIALARIPIDLDDGVKLNYEKVQTGADGKKQAILAKI